VGIPRDDVGTLVAIFICSAREGAAVLTEDGDVGINVVMFGNRLTVAFWFKSPDFGRTLYDEALGTGKVLRGKDKQCTLDTSMERRPTAPKEAVVPVVSPYAIERIEKAEAKRLKLAASQQPTNTLQTMMEQAVSNTHGRRSGKKPNPTPTSGKQKAKATASETSVLDIKSHTTARRRQVLDSSKSRGG
jgi:hypothetical protein